MTTIATQTQIIEGNEQVLPSLASVLERFNESTAKLEARHTELLEEVEGLRAQLRAKDEQMARSERLAMLGETAAGLAHEIRNPLGAIALFVSMLKSDLADRPSSIEILDHVERGIKSLDGVVSNVLHFAGNKPLNVAPMNIHSVAQELHQHFSSLYSPQSQFNLLLQGSPYILGDEHGIRQSLYNVILNALQAVSFAGTITLSIDDLSAQDGVQITLEDDGPGVPAEILESVFEPFTSGRKEGTGLGLSIVRRIIESHGGAVQVENTPHARFTITLPRRATCEEIGE
jgi:signal transduction histidine kinase